MKYTSKTCTSTSAPAPPCCRASHFTYLQVECVRRWRRHGPWQAMCLPEPSKPYGIIERGLFLCLPCTCMHAVLEDRAEHTHSHTHTHTQIETEWHAPAQATHWMHTVACVHCHVTSRLVNNRCPDQSRHARSRKSALGPAHHACSSWHTHTHAGQGGSFSVGCLCNLLQQLGMRGLSPIPPPLPPPPPT